MIQHTLRSADAAADDGTLHATWCADCRSTDSESTEI